MTLLITWNVLIGQFSHLQPQEERMKSKRRVYSKTTCKAKLKTRFLLSINHSVWFIASEQRFRTDSFSNHSMSIELDIELPLLTPFIFTPTHFQNSFLSPPQRIFAYSFGNQSTSFNCEIVTPYNQRLVTHHVTYMFNLFNPRPRKNCKKSTKNFKVSKNHSKKPKNPSKNLFPLDWVPTKLMALFHFSPSQFQYW